MWVPVAVWQGRLRIVLPRQSTWYQQSKQGRLNQWANCARAQCPGFIYYLRKDHLWGQWGKPGKYFLARGPVWLGVPRAPMQVKTLLKASQCRLAYFWDTASYRPRLPLSRAFRQPTINAYLHITAVTCIRTTFSCSERWTAGAIGPAAVKLLLPSALSISFANHTADHRWECEFFMNFKSS